MNDRELAASNDVELRRMAELAAANSAVLGAGRRPDGGEFRVGTDPDPGAPKPAPDLGAS